jgi:4,5-DOPA dioxygenase extradiol
MKRMPALFLSHGPPFLALSDASATRFWEKLGKSLEKPRAILCISAHWEAAWPMFTGSSSPETIHDFGGPAPLFSLSYPAPGDPDIAKEMGAMLEQANIRHSIDMKRGIDHGVWVPLLRMFPQADAPVIQLSIQTEMDAAHHLELGRILSSLRNRGILILGSGGATHNLPEIDQFKKDDLAPGYAREFEKWLIDAVVSGHHSALASYREQGPDADKNHPYPGEHFLPLLVAAGASEEGGKLIHQSSLFGVLSMAAFLWE